VRFIVLVKGSEESEAGIMPTEQELADMTSFNEALAKDGIVKSGEGLHPTSKGARISFGADRPSVDKGPFGPASEVVAGFWIIEADSLEEACERMSQAPFASGEIEIRQIFESQDFGEAFTPELQAREERLREQTTAS
jgi:hypothetical protein